MIQRRIVVLGIALAIGTISAIGCESGPAEIAIHVPGTSGTISGGSSTTSGLTISPSTVSLKVGQQMQFTGSAPASLLPLQYGIDRPDLLALTTDGLATALAVGVAQVAVRSTVDTTQVAVATVTITQ